MALTDSMPIYITRKNAQGDTGTLALSIWMPLVALLLVWLNVMLWGVVGLVEGVKTLI